MRRAAQVQLRFSMGSTLNPAMVVWHVVPVMLRRLGKRTLSYQDDTVIPGNGSLRVYGITPEMGPETGGTKVTLFGQYFSNYCNTSVGGHCNRFICRWAARPRRRRQGASKG